MTEYGYEILADLGDGMLIVRAPTKQVLEQPTNAHVMPKDRFERMVANVMDRGRLESLPYCYWPERKGKIQIISGHHRHRVNEAAGNKTIDLLVDTIPMPTGRMISKQLAHNTLIGYDDNDIVRQLADQMDADELLASGVSEDIFGEDIDGDAMDLFLPRLDLQWRSVTFAFLPHQLDNIKAFLESLDKNQDLIVCALKEQWPEFVKQCSAISKAKNIRSGGSVVAYLIETAQQLLEKENDAEATE